MWKGSTQGLVIASFVDIVDIVALRSSGALSSDPKWVSVQSLSVKDVGTIVTSDRSVILADQSRLHFFVPIPPTLRVWTYESQFSIMAGRVWRCAYHYLLKRFAIFSGFKI